MQHITDEDLILEFYGEGNAEPHLRECPDCRTRFQALQRTLNVVVLPVPERRADYEAQVWNRLAPKLGQHRRRSWIWGFRQWAAVAASVAVIVIAFLAGRYSPRATEKQTAAIPSAPVRDRVLVVAVGDHLERSRMVLAELVNAQPRSGLNIRPERESAENLLEANRLYRQTALATGEANVASLLEDLERVLLEVAHAPDSVSAAQLEEIQNRVERQGLVFKIRVVETQLQRRAGNPVASGSAQL